MACHQTRKGRWAASAACGLSIRRQGAKDIKPLLQMDPVVSWGEIRDLSRLGVTELEIELGRLEVHRVHEGSGAITIYGLILSCHQQLCAKTLAAMVLADPQKFDMKPAPERLTEKAADGLSILASGEDTEWGMVVRWDMQSIEGAQPVSEDLAVG